MISMGHFNKFGEEFLSTDSPKPKILKELKTFGLQKPNTANVFTITRNIERHFEWRGCHLASRDEETSNESFQGLPPWNLLIRICIGPRRIYFLRTTEIGLATFVAYKRIFVLRAFASHTKRAILTWAECLGSDLQLLPLCDLVLLGDHFLNHSLLS